MAMRQNSISSLNVNDVKINEETTNKMVENQSKSDYFTNPNYSPYRTNNILSKMYLDKNNIINVNDVKINEETTNKMVENKSRSDAHNHD